MPRLTIKELDTMPPEQLLAQRGRDKAHPEDPYKQVVTIIRKGKVARVGLDGVKGNNVTNKIANVRSAVQRRLPTEGERKALTVRRARDSKAVYVVLKMPTE